MADRKKKDLQIVVLNTNLWYSSNREINVTYDEDPAGQFAFLQSVLERAVDNDLKVGDAMKSASVTKIATRFRILVGSNLSPFIIGIHKSLLDVQHCKKHFEACSVCRKFMSSAWFESKFESRLRILVFNNLKLKM